MGRYNQLLTPSKPPEKPTVSSNTEQQTHSETVSPTDKAKEQIHNDTANRQEDNANTLERDNASTRTRVDASTLTQHSYRKLSPQSGISLYEDQQIFLTKFSLEAKLEGKKIGVSQMIRDAIDAYIENLKKEQKR